MKREPLIKYKDKLHTLVGREIVCVNNGSIGGGVDQIGTLEVGKIYKIIDAFHGKVKLEGRYSGHYKLERFHLIQTNLLNIGGNI